MATLTIADLDNGKRDLQTVEEVANSRAATATTRFGQQTITLYEAIRRINDKGDAQLAAQDAAATELILSLGFRVPVPYESGLDVSDSRFTVTGPDGKVYAPLSAPFTTGAWDPSQWYVLQNDLNDHKLLVFDSFAAAGAASATLPPGQVIEAPNAEGRLSRFEVQSGLLVFTDYAPDAIRLQSYTALRAYTGKAQAIDITTPGIAGRFNCLGEVPGATDNGGTAIIDALGRLWERLFSGPLSVKWFGALGNYENDDRPAILRAIAACRPGDFLYFPRGVYRCSDGIEFPVGVYPFGDGSPVMGTFPDRWDDKRFLRPGYKHLIPGSSLVFSGSGTQIGTTVRAAPFDSFRYAVRLVGANSPASLSGIGIIMDMDVLDIAGNLTSHMQDNRSDYDVGLFCDDITKGEVSSNIFGYWKVAGVLHYGSDPDQTVFKDGASSGERGFVVLGTGSHGHSATNTKDWNFFAAEHHLRDKDRVGTCALMIDGGGSRIGGHYFHGGRINTYCETPLILNSCNDVWFYGTLMETTFLANQGVLANSIKFISQYGNVGRVGFVGDRWNNTTPVYGNDRLSGQIEGPIVFVGGPSGVGNLSGFEMCYQNKVTRLRASSSGFEINLGGSINASTGGITIRNAGDDKITFMSGSASVATLDSNGRMEALVELSRIKRHQRSGAIIQDGAITATRSWMIVTTGTGSGGTLHTINGGTQGDELIISSGLVSEPITIDSVTGNIRAGGVATVSGANNLRLVYTGTQWQRTSQ